MLVHEAVSLLTGVYVLLPPLSRPHPPLHLCLCPLVRAGGAVSAMLSLSKSQTEVDFLVAGVETDVRSDGRARVDYR